MNGWRAKAGRRGFTLIELLVIVAIICAMAGVGVVSVRAGQGAARVKGATRDIFAAIRHARSQALVSQKPVIITYSTDEVDGEAMAKVEVMSAKLFSDEIDRSKVRTLTGEPLAAPKRELVHIRNGEDVGGDPETGMQKEEEAGGSVVQDVLFAPIKEDVIKGMRLKVVVGEADGEAAGDGRKPRLSVFSNVDYLLGKFKEKKSADTSSETSDAAEPSAGGREKDAKKKDERQAPVSVVWETNGRVDPHRVWIYADGQSPEDGLSIRIDRFGAAKVLSGDGREGGE